MNRIQELIKELCPNGVELKRLGEIASISKGDKPLEIKDKGKYKYINAGTTPSGFCDHCNSDGSAVTTPSHGQGGIGFVGFQNDSFWCGALCYKLYGIENITNVRFLYHYLSQNNYLIKQLVNEGGVPYFNQNKLENVEIPLPPLPVQTEIVRILDKFLEQQEQLEKLIELRTKQYEYYREEMLTAKEGWEKKTLGELADVTKLAGFEFTEYVEYSEEGKIIALRGLNVKNGKLVLDDVKYIDNSNFSKLNRSKLIKNDLLYTYVGTVGQVAIIEENDKYYLAPNVAMIRVKSQKNIVSKFLVYYLLSDKFKNSELERLMASSSMKNITMEKIRKFNIEYPSSEIQNEIVKTLDSFESSISALTSALELSKKRYEHYRDEMLRF